MKRAVLYLSLLVAIAAAAPALTAELNQAAIDGFNRYAQITEQHLDEQVQKAIFCGSICCRRPRQR